MRFPGRKNNNSTNQRTSAAKMGAVESTPCGEANEAIKPKAFDILHGNDDVSTMATSQSISTSTIHGAGGLGSTEEDEDDGVILSHAKPKKSSSSRELKKQNSKIRIQFWKQRSRSHSIGQDDEVNNKKNSVVLKHSSSSAVGCSTKGFGRFWSSVEELLFPKNRLLQVMNENAGNSNNSRNSQPRKSQTQKLRPGMVLLEGCETLEEHYDKIKNLCFAMKELKGREGLKAAGLEYRTVYCDEHRPVPDDEDDADMENDVFLNNLQNATATSLRSISQSLCADCDADAENVEACETNRSTGGDDVSSTGAMESDEALSLSALPADTLPDGLPNLHIQKEEAVPDDSASIRSTDSIYSENNSANPLLSLQSNNENQENGTMNSASHDEVMERCHWCSRRLFYCPDIDSRSDNDQQHQSEPIMITEDNRKRFIADGDMYEQAARLSQEYAQDVMCEEANLQWVTVDASPDRKEPLRFMISSDHPMMALDKERQDNKSQESPRPTLVICTGRGKRTLNYYCEQMSSRESAQSPLYMLSHSASGGHFARYLLDNQQSPQYFFSNLMSVAFTDSTHTIQWAAPPKPKKGEVKKPWQPHLQALYEFLQSPQCVYFRVGARASRDGVVSSGDWHMHPAGSPAPTDEYWKHRFGSIKTLWAGTNEHSLTNWHPHSKIWEHFDDCFRIIQQESEMATSA